MENKLLNKEVFDNTSDEFEKENSKEELTKLLVELDKNLKKLGFDGIYPDNNGLDDELEVDNSSDCVEKNDDIEKNKPGRIKKALGSVAIYSKNKWESFKNKFLNNRENLKDNKKENKGRFKKLVVGMGVAAVAAAGALVLRDPSAVDAISTTAYTVAHNPDNLLSLHGNFSTSDSINSLKDVSTSHHTDIIIGGTGDKDSVFPGGEILNNGASQDRINYPAGIKPAGEATFNESVEIGSEKASKAVQGAIDKGDSVNIGGYSLGSEVLAETMDKVAQNNNGELPEDVKPIFFGGPGTPNTGFFKGDTYQALKPITDQMDITPAPNYPEGSHAFARNTDFWANSGNQEITTQLSQLIGMAGDGHAITPEDIVDTSRQVVNNVDGVDIHSIHPEGTQTAALRVAEQHGFYVSPEADAFGQAIAPQDEVGVPSSGIDWNRVRDTGANLVDSIAKDNNLLSPNAANFVAQDKTDWNQIISPHALDPTPEMNQQINQFAQSVAEGMNQNSNGNVADTMPSISTDQFNQTVQQIQNAAPAPAPLPNVENFQIPQINPIQVQNDINNLMNNLR